MKKFIGFGLGAVLMVLPLAASAHGTSTWSKDSCIVTAPSGGGLLYGSGPMAPGWNVNLPDGGQGGTSKYVPYNGTTCIFNQGCMIAK